MRKWRNPVVLIGFLLIPVVFTFIFGLIFGSGDEQVLPRIMVLAVDKDDSIFSKFLLSSFQQGELKSLLDIKPVSEAEGLKLMEKGKASALLIIPEKFGENVWDRKPTEILLLKNPSEQFLPQVVEEISDITTLLFSSLLDVFPDELDLIKGFIDEGNVPDKDLSSLSLQIKNKMENLSEYVFPPIISLKQETIKTKEKSQTSLSIYASILPAMAIMFLLFICNAVFEDILREKETKTLLRMTVSPMHISEYIWSKIIISLIIGVICTFLLVVIGKIVFSIHWGNPLLVFLVIICLNILIAGFVSFPYSFIRTERQAGAVLASLIIVMSLLGGSMVPVEFLPPFVLNFSKLTVNFWGIKAFQKTMQNTPLFQMTPLLLGMLSAGFLLALLSSFFLKSALRKGLIK